MLKLLMSLIILLGVASTQVAAMEADLASDAAKPAISEILPIESSAARDMLQQWSLSSAGVDYLIGPHDLLEIEVFRVEEFSREVRVNSRGQITIPLIGQVDAAGKTTQVLEVDIAALLKQKFLQNPHVSVFIKEYASQKVTMAGQVAKPGVIVLEGRTSVMQAIAMSEGLKDMADPSSVRLIRKINGQTLQFLIDVEKIEEGEVDDIQLRGDDIVVVDKAVVKSFFISLANNLRGFIYFGAIPLYDLLR